ncbi:rhombosortase [Thalassomonas viridans]|uniref:Rhombosortase n=1 Tax=Thalassomonas viridans TaxID=137584 RepID=A0AAF0C786_9GAMM|nr:rhombosortase [Thalassomonas viridans]WDE03433.1 rhombosortase [Thalassomonas viridans]
MPNISFPPRFKLSLLLPLLVALLAVGAFFLDIFSRGNLSEMLVYHRNAVSQGELWRLLSGHFFHTNGYHLLLNLGAIALLAGLHSRYYRFSSYALLFMLSALGTSAGIYYFAPDLSQYVGLSGVLHGVFIWGALMDIKHKDKTGYLLLFGICAKIAHEQFYGASTDIVNLIDANVAIDAHLWGAVSGLVFALYSWFTVNTGEQGDRQSNRQSNRQGNQEDIQRNNQGNN